MAAPGDSQTLVMVSPTAVEKYGEGLDSNYGAVVGAGTTVGTGAVVGAGAVVGTGVAVSSPPHARATTSSTVRAAPKNPSPKRDLCSFFIELRPFDFECSMALSVLGGVKDDASDKRQRPLESP